MKLSFSKPTGAAKAKVLIIGDAGQGKTHFALGCPEPVMIDTEGGAEFFADRFNFQWTHTRSYEDILQTLKSFEKDGVPGKTLVLDSITSIYNVLLSTYPTDTFLKTPKKKFRELIDFLYGKLPCHVVMTAWEKVEYAKPGEMIDDGSGTMRKVKAGELFPIGYKMEGDAKALFAFDFVFRLYYDKKAGKRYAEVIKSRSGKFTLGQKIENPSWAMLADLVDKAQFIKRQTEEEAAEGDATTVGAASPTAQATQVAQAVAVPTEVTLARGSDQHLKKLVIEFNNKYPDNRHTSVKAYLESEKLFPLTPEVRVAAVERLEAALAEGAVEEDLTLKFGTPTHLQTA